MATSAATAARIGHRNSVRSSRSYINTTGNGTCAPQIAGTSTNTQLGGLANTNRGIARDQANGQGIGGDDFATSAATAVCIGYGNGVGSGRIYIDATGNRASAPQITGASTGTQLDGLACTNRVIARDQANGQRVNRDGFATSANATIRIGHGNAVGSGGIDGDAAGTCSGTPHIVGTARCTELSGLACTNRVIASNRTNW